jgi:threonine synthase
MDILISSNLERLLYHLSGNDDKLINEWFTSLKETGKFEIDAKLKKKLKSLFYGGWASEIETAAAIKGVYKAHGYLMDTHTAVAYKVWQDFISESGKGKSGAAINPKTRTKTIIASTASPYKFADAVYESLFGKFESVQNEIETEEGITIEQTEVMTELEKFTGICIPKPLIGMTDKEIRFSEVLEKSQIKDAVLKML